MSAAPAAAPARPGRRLSLDLFRGLTILAMVVVNTQGVGAPAWPLLVHADWFGFTLADLVFPSFLFAMGCALAMTGRPEASARDFWSPVLRRGAWLFVLGVLMYWFPFVAQQADGHWAPIAWADTRWMGVLQRTALAYVLAAVAARHLRPPALLALCGAVLAGYWAAMLLGVPGPDGLSKADNLARRIDEALIPARHLYRWDDGFEPEGLLGTLPATVNVLSGLLAVRLMRREPQAGTQRSLVLIGAGLVAAAWVLAPWVPIGKKLWTPSFVLLCVGLDLLLLALFVEVVDHRGRTPGRGLLEPLGLNPLVVYLFSELLVVVLSMVPFRDRKLWAWFCIDVVQAGVPGPAGAFLASLGYTAICWLLAWVLYRRRIVVRL